MKCTILTIVLLLCSLIPSFGQTGKLTCYTDEELLKIANKILYASECDSLYGICESQLQFKTDQNYAFQAALNAKQKELDAQKLINIKKESIITGKDQEIIEVRAYLTKANRKLKWLKIKSAGITVGLTGIILYKVIK